MTTATIDKRDYIAGLDTGEYGEFFADYWRGFVCDIVSEIADNQVDVRHYDLREWG